MQFFVTLAQAAPQPLTEKDILDAVVKALTLVGSVVGFVLAGLGGAIAFFLMRYWTNMDRRADKRERELAARELDRSKVRDVLYESLKWFEGGTQRRSIGIAVVNTSWAKFEEFRTLWIEVFANQAIYLLTVSEQGSKPHEMDNLRRIMNILIQEKALISDGTKKLLIAALERKKAGQIGGGLSVQDAWLDDWIAKLR